MAAVVPDAPESGMDSSEIEAVAVAEQFSIPCVTWSEFQSSDPKMPPGFDIGCVFRAGLNTGNLVIVRNGIEIDIPTPADTSIAEYVDGPVPVVQSRALSHKLAELRESGDAISYYKACLTIGAQTANCEGFPEDEAYIIDDNTACSQGLCLEVPDVHAVYLLSLWDWPETIYSRIRKAEFGRQNSEGGSKKPAG